MTPQGAQPAVGAGAAHAHALAAEEPPPAKPGLVSRARTAWDWVSHTRAMRANARFGARGGGVLTGGIAYAALFSVFAALTIGYTIFMKVLGGNDELRQQVLDAVDKALPGLVDNGDGGGGINPDDLVLNKGLTITGAIAVVVLLLSALAAVSAMRKGVQAMFADDGTGTNGVIVKARELGGFAGMAIAVLVSAIITIAVTTVTQWILSGLGWGGATTTVLTVAGVLVAFLVDAGVFVLVVTVLAGQHPPRKDLLQGAVLAGIGLGVVRLLGTQVVAGSVNKNPLFASVAVIVTLLLWINLIARIILLASAWTADPPYVEKVPRADPQDEKEPSEADRA
ncbi:YihY/virulence factor BrkB family protein [Cellulomonas sp. McL0617]|uniref:YihY/virulence factor BrkB family protein n=1 Tax=Cellulomonas sp. McL0617 TaxID=3415675 RepID=UPI003CF8630D